MRILIPEDDSVSRRMLQGVLTKWGYDAVSIEDSRAWFAIVIGAPNRARLKVSSKLLFLACAVAVAGRGGNN